MTADPVDIRWRALQARWRPGQLVTVTVVAHRPFGVLVDVGEEGISGVIQITEFKENAARTTPDEFPPLGATVTAVVLAFREPHKQVSLSVRPSRKGGAKL